MSSNIMEGLRQVVRPADDMVLTNDNGTYRNFSLGCSLSGLGEGLTHIVLIFPLLFSDFIV
jgi:hypothetical protein